MREEGLLTDEDDATSHLSPAEERARRAEKRAAWRQARLKSLEQDAIQAQNIIKSMTDMVSVAEVPLICDETDRNQSPEVSMFSVTFRSGQGGLCVSFCMT